MSAGIPRFKFESAI